jgi:hypothetical protein
LFFSLASNVLNRIAEDRRPSFVPLYLMSPLSVIVAVGFPEMSFIRLEKFPSVFNGLKLSP